MSFRRSQEGFIVVNNVPMWWRWEREGQGAAQGDGSPIRARRKEVESGDFHFFFVCELTDVLLGVSDEGISEGRGQGAGVCSSRKRGDAQECYDRKAETIRHGHE